MVDKDFYRKLWRVAFPIAFQNLMLSLVAVADALMLGAHSQDSMAAVSLATQIQFIQNMFIASSVEAAAILGAQYWGKRDITRINDVFAICFKLTVGISFVFFAGCVLAPRMLMTIFTNDFDLIAIGADYLRIAGWSYLITGVSQSYLALMKVTDHPNTTAKISTFAVIANICLNAVFIFGCGPIPAMGVKGAAVATLIARILELALSVAMSLKPGYQRVRLSDIARHNAKIFADYYRCLLPMLGAWLLWGIGFTSYTAFMGHLGKDAAAANALTATIRDVICCLCNGLAGGGGIVVGNELGAGRLTEGRIYGDRLVWLSVVFGIISTILMLLLTPVVLHFADLTNGARDLLWKMMSVMAFYMIGRAFNTVTINGVFAAGGDTLFDMYSLAVCMWCIAVPLAAAGTFLLGWSPVVVYACTCLDEVGKIPWVLHHHHKHIWVRNLTR